MVPLDSDRWSKLWQAYGNGSRIAEELLKLRDSQSTAEADRLWYEMDVFSTLLHQGTCYSATLAALPHLIQFVETLPLPEAFKLATDIMHFVGLVGYHQPTDTHGDVPDDIKQTFQESLERAAIVIGTLLQQAQYKSESEIYWLFRAFAGVSYQYDLFLYLDDFGREPICDECGTPLCCPECQSESGDSAVD